MNDKINTTLAIVFRTPFRAIRAAQLGFDGRHLQGAGGMRQSDHQRGYPAAALRPAEDHLRCLEEEGRIGRDGAVLLCGTRNVINNRRALMVRDGVLYQGRDEEAHRSRRPYYGIAGTKDGRIEARAIDFREGVDPDLAFFVSGTPTAWNGSGVPLELMACEAADPSHAWHVERTDPRSVAIARVFEEQRHASVEEASAALLATADGLPRCENYLHHCLAVGPDALYNIIAVGSLERLGEIALAAGATSSIAVEQGGSVQLGIRMPGKPHAPLFTSWYFRCPAICVFAYEVTVDGTGRVPIEGVPDMLGTEAWRAER